MMNLRNKFFVALVACLALEGCAREKLDETGGDADGFADVPIALSGDIAQVYQTRVNDGGFADGDRIGIYVVDYDGDTPGEMKTSGNRADNVWFQFNGGTRKWNSAREIYWKDKKTHVDIYGYYPFTAVEDVSSLSFEVRKDQSSEASGGELSGYEASDFLWGKAADVAPTSNTVNVSLSHRMASVRISLREGTGFATGEWADASKSVLVTGTGRAASIDLADGSVKVDGEADGSGIIPSRAGDEWRAIVVPQTLPSGTRLVAITVDGLPYGFARDDDFTFTAGKQHNFTINVNKKPEGDFEFVLSDESITAWENDPLSHDGVAREYVVVGVPTAGTLEQCIKNSGKDLEKIRNLKITGQIDSRDFETMKNKMTYLTALNLKEVRIMAYSPNKADCIPAFALAKKESLVLLILPDRLVSIEDEAFCECVSLSGNVTFPEGLVSIGKAAFRNCQNLSSVNFPSTLRNIGYELGYNDSCWDGTFAYCSSLCCELILPEGLEVVGRGAFRHCPGLYGSLHLPESLKGIGDGAFMYCSGLTGSLVIPQSISVIRNAAFNECGFNGTLKLHDGITSIGENAFSGSHFKGELILPSELEVISADSFRKCEFSGKLVLPKTLRVIGNRAFAWNWRITGLLEIPDDVISIGAGAFAQCKGLEGVIFPEGLETIRSDVASGGDMYGAFIGCYGINSIICKGSEPPVVQNGAFDGVSKDNFTVEVPENAIVGYSTSAGWKDFKRITAYRNLSVRPNVATAINTKATRDFVLYADDEWEVAEHPEWTVLSQMSGKGKTQMSVTFTQMPRGAKREGKVVFKLKDKDWRVSLNVSQHDFQYAEDEIITLQSATRGRGVDIVFLGDGYSAEDISGGKLLKDIGEAVGDFFAVEPYRTYRDWFNVYTAVSVSPESGIGGVNTVIYNRFNTTAKGGATLGGRNDSDFAEILSYACKAPTVSAETLGQTLVVMVPNTSDYGGITYLFDNGGAISYCPKSDCAYPYDFRGIVQHEAGGHGFGHLADEYIQHNAFIDACGCSCCGHVQEINEAKAKGWYGNISLSGKSNEVPWEHLMWHEKYSGIVDIYEGAYMHSRGVYRSEYNSCMNNDIPYFSTVSREAIVRRIMSCAGEEYSFEDFVANDRIVNLPETAALTKGGALPQFPEAFSDGGACHSKPVFMGAMPSVER